MKMNEFKKGDLVYHNKYHHGLLELVEVHKSHVIVGKHSRVLLPLDVIRKPTAEEIKKHHISQIRYD